jgi:transcriptional regulator with PAS, ATPase and Fis domain
MEANMNDASYPDMFQLERLSESVPDRFLGEYAVLVESHKSGSTRMMLEFLKCKAFITMNKYQEAEDTALAFMEEAIDNNDYAMIARGNIILSKCYSAMKNGKDVKILLDIALNNAKKTKDNSLITLALTHIGSYHQKRNERIEAISSFEKAEKQIANSGDIRTQVNTLLDHSSAYYYFGEYKKALPLLTRALKLCNQTNDIERSLLIVNNLATLYMMMHKFDDAEQMMLTNLEQCEKFNNPMRKINVLVNLGVLNLRQDNFEAALQYFEKCRQLAISIGLHDPRFLMDLNSNFAGCYRFLGKPEEALRHLDIAHEQATIIGDQNSIMEVQVNRANMLIGLGEFTESRKHLRSIIKYATKEKHYHLLTVAYKNYARTYEVQGNYPKAIENLLKLTTVQNDFHAQLMAEQSKEYDVQIQNMLNDYSAVQQQYSILAEGLKSEFAREFVGSSDAHKRVLESALLAAQHPSSSVLILGESGTGKDVLARIIHLSSSRRNQPFIAVNMAAISSSLLESEFFGHKRGSFTGATTDTKGFFLEANKGTLFLDEISEMPIALQAKLLRVLESRRLTPVGSSSEIGFDTRIISSTNRDVLDMISKDTFRLDLYHRLNTIEIYIPPLRERPADIAALLVYYTDKIAKDMKLPIPRIDNSFIEKLQGYRFPGNVRELKNIVERLLIMFKSRDWNADTLNSLPSLKMELGGSVGSDMQNKKMNVERSEIIDALERSNGKQKEAAKLLGISESTLTRKIKNLNLEIYTRKGK